MKEYIEPALDLSGGLWPKTFIVETSILQEDVYGLTLMIINKSNIYVDDIGEHQDHECTIYRRFNVPTVYLYVPILLICILLCGIARS